MMRSMMFRRQVLPSRRSAVQVVNIARRSFSSDLPHFKYKVEDLYDTNYLDMPKLPLPKVEDTLKRYLETVRPVATDEEFARTVDCVNEFQRESGDVLQKKLIELSSGAGYPYSYIETFWDEMYQAGRWEVMVNSNPHYFFHEATNPAEMDQTFRAANLASACLRWWEKVVGGTLEADMERGKPLCMYGHGLVFGSTRVPTFGRDTMATNFDRKHIIVICKHRYFRVEVVDGNGRSISTENLKDLLDDIKDAAEASPGSASEDIGVLTAGERDRWATLRQELVATDPTKTNAKTLDAVDDCLFVIALDESVGNTDAERSSILLHGKDGSNRWWDKHNIIALSDGTLGMNFDHTFGDGLTWNRMLHEAYCDMQGMASGFSKLNAPSDFKGSVEPLQWKLTDTVSSSVMDLERQKTEKLAQDCQTSVLHFNEYGRNRMKEMKMSPDAVTQMSFQLGYMRLHGKKPVVYESCAMKNFFHGRTETIRSFTNESLAMAKAFLNDESDDEKRAKLAEACRVHVEVAKGAKSAQGPYLGVDRHLHAMKCIALREGMDVPLFNDPMYTKSSTWVLSTSNVTAPFIHLFGFGAVCGHGYGLGYMTQPEHIPVNCTSFKSNPETDSDKYLEAIAESLRDFNKLY